MELSLYRGEEILRQERSLPAVLYNLLHTLLAGQRDGCLFVPIRSMQYLAVVDREEVVFVDGHTKHMIDVAWQSFKPRERQALEDAVPYEAVIYTQAGRDVLGRLQAEFSGALTSLERKRPTPGDATVLDFATRARSRKE